MLSSPKLSYILLTLSNINSPQRTSCLEPANFPGRNVVFHLASFALVLVSFMMTAHFPCPAILRRLVMWEKEVKLQVYCLQRQCRNACFVCMMCSKGRLHDKLSRYNICYWQEYCRDGEKKCGVQMVRIYIA